VIRFRGEPGLGMRGVGMAGRGLDGVVFEVHESFAKTGDGRALVEAAVAQGLEFPASPDLDVPADPDDGLDIEINTGVDPTGDAVDDPGEWEDDDDYADDEEDGDSGNRGLLGLVIGVGVALLIGLLFIFRRR